MNAVLMLFPRGQRPPHHTEHPVPSTVAGHDVRRIDALPPFAHPRGGVRFICRTCNRITASVPEHDAFARDTERDTRP